MARKDKRIAAATAYIDSRWCRTIKLERLPALQVDNPLQCPTTQNRILRACGITHVLLTFSEREFIAPAEVQNIANIEVGQAIVSMDSYSRNIGPSVCVPRKIIQQIQRVRTNFGIRVRSQEVKAARKFFLNIGLQSMVVAASRGLRVTRAFCEIWKGQAALRSWQWAARQARVQDRTIERYTR